MRINRLKKISQVLTKTNNKMKQEQELDQRHLEYEILRMKSGKIKTMQQTERGHVMITPDQALIMNSSPSEKGMHYVLDKKNPTNKGTKHPTLKQIRKELGETYGNLLADDVKIVSEDEISIEEEEEKEETLIELDDDMSRKNMEAFAIQEGLELDFDDYKNKGLLLEAIKDLV